MDIKTIVIAILSAIVMLDQALAAIPSIKANATYQLITNALSELLAIGKDV